MSIRLNIEIDENTLKELVRQYMSEQIGQIIEIRNIEIEVKSKQNYKSEWESAQFRARITQYRPTLSGEK